MNTKTAKTPGILQFFRDIRNDQSGQTLVMTAVVMTGLLGMSGLVIDTGRIYAVKSQLQNTANAAALAAAGYVYTSQSSSVNMTTQADAYGATGTQNTDSYVTIAPTVQLVCLNILESSGSTCSSSSSPNAVRVTETATMTTTFMKLFGVSKLNVSATATASMLGGQPQSWNVALILDASGSMSNVDSNCGSGVTQFQCATTAIQTMLGAANPCKPGYTSCATANSNLRFSLFSFPAVSTATVGNDTNTNCSATPTFMVYPLPLPSATSYTPATYNENGSSWTATYQIVPFSSDYYSATASNHLNTSSNLVGAVTGCMTPIKSTTSGYGVMQGAPSSTNGGITYYASVIYAAQSALVAEQKLYPGSKNAIIFMSDGQANMPASADDMPSEQNSTLASGSTGYTTPGVNGKGIYPDVVDECQQAIVASQYATNAGTAVYAVAYGAEAQGCSYTVGTTGSSGSYGTDSTNVATGKNVSFTDATISPCITMENIASSLSNFYSDYNQSDSGNGVDKTCVDNSHPVSSLKDILLSVVTNFLQPRLVPSSAPYTVVTGS